MDEAFQYPALIVGIALAIGFAIEARGGLRNLVRIDLFMLATLFLLTFLEFLFPQDSIAGRVAIESAQTAVIATLLGFAGIVLGRHLFPAKRPAALISTIEVSPTLTIRLLLACFVLGYIYIFLSVDFDPFEVVYQMSRPRFSQPWTRGRLGGISTLLGEFGLLTYLIPPLVAAVFAQARRYSLLQKVIALLMLAFVFYEAFAGGTRNIFLTHLATFAATYALLTPSLTWIKAARIAVPVLVVGGLAVYLMAEIRTVGLTNFDLETSRTSTLFVDMNLINIAGLTEVFPRYAPYLGWEIPYTAMIRPIPRAIWPGKPEGLSFSIEEALGVGPSMTLAATFVGELWMAGGYLAIAIGALVFGAAAAAWNRIGAAASSNLELILFATGFFPAGLCMRGLLAVAPALLPALALYVFLKLRDRSQPRRRPPSWPAPAKRPPR